MKQDSHYYEAWGEALESSEEALRLSEASLEAVIESSGEGIVTLFQNGRIGIVNSAALKMFGYEPGEIDGLPASEIIPNATLDWLQSAKRGLNQYMRASAHMDCRGRRKDGSFFLVDLSIASIETATQVRFFLTVRDLTERMLVEEAARRSEQKFRSLVAATSSIVWNASPGGYFSMPQPSWEHYTGQTWEAHAIFGWLEAIHPDDRESIRHLWYETVKERGIFETSCRLWNASQQQYRHIDLRAVPVLNVDASVDEWIGTVTDIQDRIEAEQTKAEQESMARFNRLIDNVPGMLYQLELENNEVIAFPYVSPGAGEILGIDPGLVQESPSLLIDLIHPDDRDAFLEAFAAAQPSLSPAIWEGRIQIEGEMRWVQSASRPESPAGRSVLWNGVLMDVTERKMLEAQLGQAQKLESIGQLAAGIAHEINTPIQYIGDNIRFLQDAVGSIYPLAERLDTLLEQAGEGSLSPDTIAAERAALEAADLDYLLEETPKAISQSLEGINHVANIVAAMKEFSHPGSEDKKYIDLNHAIETTLTIARNEWKYVAELETDLSPDLPLVPCLPGELNQVVLNLIVNAAHAIEDVVGPDGLTKGRIAISTRRIGESVEIRVQDTGAGIPADIQQRVFDPFFTTKPVGKGTGQGLAIAYAVIVDKHGGSLDFVTEERVGTTFIITLPLSH
ncbi:MAG: PAS domain S-box protein [Rhodothermales bacterium]